MKSDYMINLLTVQSNAVELRTEVDWTMNRSTSLKLSIPVQMYADGKNL